LFTHKDQLQTAKKELRRSSCKNCGKDPTIQSILGLCARSKAHDLFYCRLIKEVDRIEDWTKLPQQAESHGLAPLASKHLQAVDALLPDSTRRDMQALLLRHRKASQVHTQALGEILLECNQRGIETFLLKGAALAHLVYPEPGMRPMKDLDFLVRPQDARSLELVLVNLGYQPSPPKFYKPETAFHLPPMVRVCQGMRVNIEVHTNLFPDRVFYQPDLFDRLTVFAQTFGINGVAARTLCWEDMLWHVHGHACGLAGQLNVEFHLLGVADLVSIVEKYHEKIDWTRIRKQYPRLYHALPALHFMTPWSDAVIQRLGMRVEREPRGAIRAFQGWPLKSRQSLLRQGMLKSLGETFFPSEWWLRVHYGSDHFFAVWVHRWIVHPWHVLCWAVIRLLANRL
jgi:hypothetical protein